MAEDLSAFAKKRKSKKIRRFVFLGILLVALFGTCLYFALENYFVVEDVSVKKSSIYSTADIVKTIQIEKKTPLYRLSKKKIVSAIEEKFPYILDVKIKFKLPDTVQITYQEEYGEMALALGDDVYAIDRELFVLAKEGKNTEIPRIKLACSSLDRCVVGESLSFTDEGIAPALLELLSEMKKSKMLSNITSIDVSDKFNLKMNYGDRFLILLGDRQDIKLKLAMIREVIADLDEGATGRIDISDADNAYVKLDG